LLAKTGVDAVILEQKSKEYVLARISVGVLEQGAAELIEEARAAGRLRKEGFVHDGTEIAFNCERAPRRVRPKATPTTVSKTADLRCAMFRLPVSIPAQVEPT
jgi:hypothetical protein